MGKLIYYVFLLILPVLADAQVLEEDLTKKTLVSEANFVTNIIPSKEVRV